MTANGLPTILFVATPPPLGGSNRSLATILANLDGKAHRVLACPPFGSFIEFVREHDLADEIVELPRRPGHPLDRFLRIGAGLVIARWAFANRNRLDGILANALTGLNLSTPAVLTTRKPISVWVHDPVGSKWGRRLGPVLRRLLPKLKIAAVSETAEAIAVENGLCDAGDATIIPNPIDPAEVLATSHRSGEGSIHIGYIGGATPRKGFDLLPDVIHGIADLPAQWKLFVHLVPGPGNAEIWEEMATFDRSIVDPVGKTPNIGEIYEDIDIAFIPSRAESFCRVAAEAMMNGVPVVGSDIDPLQALLGDNEAGLIFPSEDVGAAVAHLRTLINDAELRARLGEAGKKRSERFAPEAVTNDLLALILR